MVAALALVATWALFFDFLPPHKRVHLYSDIEGYHFPLLSFAFHSLKEGRIPQWDPSIYCGISFIGNVQTMLLYPATWLMYAAVWTRPRLPFLALEVLTFFHVWLAFVFCYLWLRGRTAKLPSALGAGSFAFTGYMLGSFWHLGVVSSMAWMPLGLWGVDEARERRDWRPLWKVALASAMSFLAGYPACWLVFAVMAVVHALSGSERLRVAAGTCAALAASALLFMAALLPALEARSLMVWEPKYGLSVFGWRALPAYLMANWFDFNPGHPEEFQTGCTYLYLGLPALFALLWMIGQRRFRTCAQPLIGLAVAVLLGNPPIALVRAVEMVPALDGTMQSDHFYAAVAAMAALITALAMDDFFKRDPVKLPRRFPQWAVNLAILPLVAWTCRQVWLGDHGGVFPIRFGAVGATLLALVAFSLAAWAVRRSIGRRRAILTAALLCSVWVDYRVYGGVRQFNAQRGNVDKGQAAYGIAGVDPVAYRAMRENFAYRVVSLGPASPHPTDYRLWGLATPQGFDPFLPAQYKAAIERWVPFRTNRLFDVDARNDAMLQALGARYIVLHGPGPDEAWLQTSPKFRLLGRDDMFFRVYEYLLAKPPYGWEDAALNAAARPVSWLPERREFVVNSQRGGRFFLAEQFFPGWKASVDGAPAATQRWAGAFQSVAAPSGEHRIRFEYASPGFRAGAVVSLLAVFALAGLALADARSRRRTSC